MKPKFNNYKYAEGKNSRTVLKNVLRRKEGRTDGVPWYNYIPPTQHYPNRYYISTLLANIPHTKMTC